MDKWIFKAKKIVEIPIKSWDNEEQCYSSVEIYWGANGHIYYAYKHSDWTYCPLHNVPIENCIYDEIKRSCCECPDTKDFIVTDENDIPLPVNRLT